jgi:hypothetical protein
MEVMMKLFFGFLIVFTMIFSATNVFADSSKIIKVDLDVSSTVIIRADLGQDDLYYYIDKTACVCWLSRTVGGSIAMTVVDCKGISNHPKLKGHLEDCLKTVSETPVAVAPAPIVEVKKEETMVEPETKKTKKK